MHYLALTGDLTSEESFLQARRSAFTRFLELNVELGLDTLQFWFDAEELGRELRTQGVPALLDQAKMAHVMKGELPELFDLSTGPLTWDPKRAPIHMAQNVFLTKPYRPEGTAHADDVNALAEDIADRAGWDGVFGVCGVRGGGKSTLLNRIAYECERAHKTRQGFAKEFSRSSTRPLLVRIDLSVAFDQPQFARDFIGEVARSARLRCEGPWWSVLYQPFGQLASWCQANIAWSAAVLVGLFTLLGISRLYYRAVQPDERSAREKSVELAFARVENTARLAELEQRLSQAKRRLEWFDERKPLQDAALQKGPTRSVAEAALKRFDDDHVDAEVRRAGTEGHQGARAAIMGEIARSQKAYDLAGDAVQRGRAADDDLTAYDKRSALLEERDLAKAWYATALSSGAPRKECEVAELAVRRAEERLAAYEASQAIKWTKEALTPNDLVVPLRPGDVTHLSEIEKYRARDNPNVLPLLGSKVNSDLHTVMLALVLALVVGSAHLGRSKLGFHGLFRFEGRMLLCGGLVLWVVGLAGLAAWDWWHRSLIMFQVLSITPFPLEKGLLFPYVSCLVALGLAAFFLPSWWNDLLFFRRTRAALSAAAGSEAGSIELPDVAGILSRVLPKGEDRDELDKLGIPFLLARMKEILIRARRTFGKVVVLVDDADMLPSSKFHELLRVLRPLSKVPGVRCVIALPPQFFAAFKSQTLGDVHSSLRDCYMLADPKLFYLHEGSVRLRGDLTRGDLKLWLVNLLAARCRVPLIDHDEKALVACKPFADSLENWDFTDDLAELRDEEQRFFERVGPSRREMLRVLSARARGDAGRVLGATLDSAEQQAFWQASLAREKAAYAAQETNLQAGAPPDDKNAEANLLSSNGKRRSLWPIERRPARPS